MEVHCYTCRRPFTPPPPPPIRSICGDCTREAREKRERVRDAAPQLLALVAEAHDSGLVRCGDWRARGGRPRGGAGLTPKGRDWRR